MGMASSSSNAVSHVFPKEFAGDKERFNTRGSRCVALVGVLTSRNISVHELETKLYDIG